MKILAVDTSTALSSLAIVESGVVVATASHTDPRGHVEAIGTLFTQLDCNPDDLPELIACGVGPGPYTGLRVGIAFAQGLSAAWSVPIVGVCSLDAVAHAVIRDGRVQSEREFMVATDARRKEFYWARFDLDGDRLTGPSVDLTGVVEDRARELGIELITDVLPLAIDIAACAEHGQPVGVAPMYLRGADALPSSTAAL